MRAGIQSDSLKKSQDDVRSLHKREKRTVSRSIERETVLEDDMKGYFLGFGCGASLGSSFDSSAIGESSSAEEFAGSVESVLSKSALELVLASDCSANMSFSERMSDLIHDVRLLQSEGICSLMSSTGTSDL